MPVLIVNEKMPSERLTARVPTTPTVRDELKRRVDRSDAETYDDYLRFVFGLPAESPEKAN